MGMGVAGLDGTHAAPESSSAATGSHSRAGVFISVDSRLAG
jgi:hypothetical protein